LKGGDSLLKEARAFCPAGISSFFEICDRTSDGRMITDLERLGARGGGFSPDKGVTTEIVLSEAKEKNVQVFINGKSCPEAYTTKSVTETLLDHVSEIYNVIVRHQVDIPIGAGFGSSAAGALGTALALSKALDLNFTYNQLGKIAHVSEIKSRTGLGTVGPLLFGGCGLTIEPGAPGYAILDRIPVSPDHRLVVGTFRPYPTRELLSSQQKKEIINEKGQKTLKCILDNPSLENFMTECKKFALETGFATERIQKLMELSEKAGAIGAAQNMLGEAVHVLTTTDTLKSVHEAFKKMLPEEKIIIANIDFQGARLIK
jgi:pantoate kinase